jgi:predicted phosphodiesterase
MTSEENLDYLQDKGIALCLHGHSHTPGVYARDHRSVDHHLCKATIPLHDYRNSLVCPGSVGQPRNRNNESQCAIYDREKQEMVFVALPYCVDTVVEKIKRQGLPKNLWQRLLTGI